MFPTLCFGLAMIIVTVNGFLSEESNICYDQVGCFSSEGAFASTISWPFHTTPEAPSVIKTQFLLYTRNNKKDDEKLDAMKVTSAKSTFSNFDGTRPTKFICHGFIDDIELVTWLHEMKDELLIQGDYNVVIVDWSHGNLPPYYVAAANTRVVGAQIALLIKQLMKDFDSTADQFHVIGHSLGSHVAGYAGEKIENMGRITGLDPAGPYFSGTDKVVRLDPTDAVFVDTIHSDYGGIASLAFGSKEPDGHLDFYPNLGHDQPGCEKDIKSTILRALTKGLIEGAACNHLRSIKFFTESINTKCPFMAFPCDSAADFTANKCHSCPKGGCASMGFHSIEHKPSNGKHLKYYTTTAAEAPFCQYHLDVTLRMVDSSYATDETGTVQLKVYGDGGTSNWVYVNKDAVTFDPGMVFERTVVVPHNFGKLRSMSLKWTLETSILHPSKWSWFGFRNAKLYLHEVDIVRQEAGKEVHFCAQNDDGIEDDTVMGGFNVC